MTTATAVRTLLADLSLDTRSDTFAGDRVAAMNAASDARLPHIVDIVADVDPDEGGTVDQFRTALRVAIAALV